MIFFDLGNTLVTGGGQSARRMLGSRLSLSEKQVKIAGRLLMTFQAVEPSSLAFELVKAIPELDMIKVESAVRWLWNEQFESVREIPGAASLLKSLKAMGYRIGIISNTWHPFYMGFCNECSRILDLVDLIFLSYNLGCKKPSVKIFHRAVEEAEVPPEFCWMVGDSYELDVQPSQYVGMHTVWFLSRPEVEKDLLVEVLSGGRPGPDLIAEDFSAILHFFEGVKPSQS